MFDIKKWYLSRTIWLAIGQFVVGGLLAISNIHPEWGWALVVKSIFDVILRLNTTQPIQ